MKTRTPLLSAIGLALAMSTAAPLVASTNLTDAIDANEVPAENELRKGGELNKAEPIDKNKTPEMLEERQKEEEWRESYDEDQADTQDRQNEDEIIE
jgi:hypothetical protein